MEFSILTSLTQINTFHFYDNLEYSLNRDQFGKDRFPPQHFYKEKLEKKWAWDAKQVKEWDDVVKEARKRREMAGDKDYKRLVIPLNEHE